MPEGLTLEQSDRLNVEVVPLNNAAHDCLQKGELEECFRLLRQATANAEAIVGPVHEYQPSMLEVLAYELYHVGQYEEAEGLCLRSVAINEVLYGIQHLEVAHALFCLGCLYDYWERYEMSLPVYRRALAIEEAFCGKGSHEAAETCAWLGDAHVELSQYAEAEPYLRRAVVIHRARQAVDGTEVLILTLERLAGVLFRLKRYNDALVAYQELRELTGGRFQFRNSRRRFNRCRVKCAPATEAVMQRG